jgi:hypothetical protein
MQKENIMPFEIGREKTGGRKAGTLNRRTSEMRDVFKQAMDAEIQGLPELLKQLEPEKRLDLVIKLLPYVMPRVNPVSMNEGEPFSWG